MKIDGAYGILSSEVILWKIAGKLQPDHNGLIEHGPITVVAFGDSVTHGAVAEGEIRYETVYWNRLRQKLNAVCGKN